MLDLAAAPLVLVVDDLPDVREMLRVRIQLAGLQVATAANGKEAVEMARILEPRIVILDLQMPVMGGLEALPLLRCIDPSMRIIIHSGSANVQEGDLRGDLRPDAIVPKGRPLPQLMEAVERLAAQDATDTCLLAVPPIPLQRAIHAFDSWLGLHARIRQHDAPIAEGSRDDDLGSLTRIFFELGLQLLKAAQAGASEVALTMSLRRETAESALRALEGIRASGFDAFYASWGYVPVAEAIDALKELSDRLAQTLVALTAHRR